MSSGYNSASNSPKARSRSSSLSLISDLPLAPRRNSREDHFNGHNKAHHTRHSSVPNISNSPMSRSPVRRQYSDTVTTSPSPHEMRRCSSGSALPSQGNGSEPPVVSQGRRKSLGTIPVISGLATKTQPKVVYDLLSGDQKSSSFHVRFETEIPQPRFVIHHRNPQMRMSDLTSGDFLDLISTCLTFAEHHQIEDASITVPFGKFNRVLKLCEGFSAYLETPYPAGYLKVYEKFKADIPRWNCPTWINHHWPQRQRLETVDDVYTRAIKASDVATRLTVQHRLLERRHQKPTTDVRRQAPKGGRRNSTPSVTTTPTLRKWHLVEHPTVPLVGVACRKGDVAWSLRDRREALEFLVAVGREHLKDRRYGYYVCVSLVDAYRFGKGIFQNVIGFLALPEGVPASLSNVAKQLPSSRRLSGLDNPDSGQGSHRGSSDFNSGFMNNFKPFGHGDFMSSLLEQCCMCFRRRRKRNSVSKDKNKAAR